MITWQFYFDRRRVTDKRQWAVARGIVTYTDLSKILNALGTTIPDAEEAISTFLPLPLDLPALQPIISDEAPVDKGKSKTRTSRNAPDKKQDGDAA